MPNQNIIERLVGANSPAQGSLAIPALILGSNTETLFTNQLGNTAILNPPGGQFAGAASAPSFGSSLDGFAFKVRATFKCSTGGTSTAIISIYAGTTINAGNKIATITSQSLTTASASGFLEATLIWDSVSQKLSGLQSGAFGTTAVSATTTANQPTVTTLAGLQFVATANLGSNVAGNTFTLTEFVMEVV